MLAVLAFLALWFAEVDRVWESHLTYCCACCDWPPTGPCEYDRLYPAEQLVALRE